MSATRVPSIVQSVLAIGHTGQTVPPGMQYCAISTRNRTHRPNCPPWHAVLCNQYSQQDTQAKLSPLACSSYCHLHHNTQGCHCGALSHVAVQVQARVDAHTRILSNSYPCKLKHTTVQRVGHERLWGLINQHECHADCECNDGAIVVWECTVLA